MQLTGPRLTLFAATLAHLEAELAGPPGALGRLLGASVPPSWPPGEYDTAALTYFHAQLRDGGAAAVGWYGWYAIAEAAKPAAVLIGAGGFLGPPSPTGVVELGYSVTPEHQRQGYATELSACLVAHAWRVPEVRTILAHTTAANVASVRVLERVGFSVAGAGAEPGQVRYVHRGPATQ